MVMGRPTEFKVLGDLDNLEDCEVCTKDFKNIKTDSFKKEQDLSEFILLNLEVFCSDILGDRLVSFETEKEAGAGHRRFGPRRVRVDIYIVCEKHNYIVELKNPTHPAENRAGIGQILNYGRLFDDVESKLIIITTKYDIDTARTIAHYNLPIRYIYLDKNRVLEWRVNGSS